MAFKDPVREKEYQKAYQQNYKKKILIQLRDELKSLAQQHEIVKLHKRFYHNL